MGKQGASLESLIKYRDEGWRFSIKNVKGKKYITRKLKGEERSLGPYSDDLWNLILETTEEQGKDAFTPSNEDSPRRTVVSVAESVVGLRIVKAIKAMGVEPGDVSGLIEEVYKESLNQRIEPVTFVKVAKGMHEMRVEGRGDYSALEKEVKTKRSLSDSLGEKVSELSRRAEKLSEGNAEAERKLEETNRTLQSRSELIGKLKEAEALGLRPSQLGIIVETARKAGARHGLSIKDSLDWLARDLEENWEPKLGFEDEKTRLSIELEQMNEKVKLAEGKEKRTLERVRTQEEALRGLEELRKIVSSSELVYFKKIIVDSGQDVSTFCSEVERLGSVTQAVGLTIQKKVSDLNNIEGRVVTLQAQESKLINQKRILEGEIKTLSSDTVKSIMEANIAIHEVADGLKADFDDPVNGYRARIKSLGDKAVDDVDVELKSKREALKKSLESLSGFITRSTAEVESLKKNSWEIGKLVGSSIHLARLAKIVAGESVGTVEGVATMKMVVDSFTDYLAKNNLVSRCPSATRFSDELRRVIL